MSEPRGSQPNMMISTKLPWYFLLRMCMAVEGARGCLMPLPMVILSVTPSLLFSTTSCLFATIKPFILPYALSWDDQLAITFVHCSLCSLCPPPCDRDMDFSSQVCRAKGLTVIGAASGRGVEACRTDVSCSRPSVPCSLESLSRHMGGADWVYCWAVGIGAPAVSNL